MEKDSIIIKIIHMFLLVGLVSLISGCTVEPPPDTTPTPAPTDIPTPTPEITGDTIGIEIDNDGFRRWADGTYACSCNDYINPVDTDYQYKDDTGSGFYRIQPLDALVPLEVYCDMVTENGGWTLVLLNSTYTTPPSPLWVDAIRANNIEGTILDGIVSGFDQLLGLKYWEDLGTRLRVETGNDPLTIVHRGYYDFDFDEEDHYTIYLSDEVISAGSTSPGLYTSHNYQPFTTWDSDNDSYGTNCSASFSNTPWWYTSCWSGSFWGGGGSAGYQNKPYWTGCDGDYYNWGAFWIK